jgi:hypothetical protein
MSLRNVQRWTKDINEGNTDMEGACSACFDNRTQFADESRRTSKSQGISRVIMSQTELKMKPTIHFQKKPDILISVASFFRKCSVGCIFNSVGLIVTLEISCIF